jgi:uncharacterized repeat protein (TIGR01451 family)
MRFGRSLPLLAAFAATAVALMVLAGAGTAASTPHPAKAAVTGTSLASVGTGPAAMTKIKSFLRSVGIDPSTVVIQTGKHNYAGARCPGKRWSCTSATRVFQAGSDNVFQCSPAVSVVSSSNSGGNQSCVISQSGTTNSATCTEHTDSPAAVQLCQITQSGRSNVANVNQQNGSNGTTQSAKQTAIVNQSGGAASNRATITQTIAQDASGASTLMQDGWARADLVQSSSGTGKNTANVTQNIRQGATGGTNQAQDTLAGSIGDCDPAEGPTNPNLCANVSQTGSGGDNTNNLFQKVQEKGTTARVATQRQGSGAGGIDAKIHQDTGSTATNYNGAYQHKIQSLSAAPGSSQTQFDPVFCCGAGSQAGGNSLNQDSLGQGFAQEASQRGAAQSGDIIGESLSPNGRCSITHDASNNADSTTNSASEQPCPFLLLETSCGNGGEGGGCTASEPVTTPPGGEPDSTLAKCVRNISRQETACTTGTLITSFPQTIEYQLTYTNTGTGTAHGVQVFDTPPSGFTETGCSDNCVGQEGGGVAWSLGDMAPGSTKTVTLTGTIGCANTSNSGFMSDQEGEEVASNSATTTDGCIS